MCGAVLQWGERSNLSDSQPSISSILLPAAQLQEARARHSSGTEAHAPGERMVLEVQGTLQHSPEQCSHGAETIVPHSEILQKGIEGDTSTVSTFLLHLG